MADIVLAFAAVSAIIFIGFFASLIFERTRIPDLLFLIFLGLFLGPIAKTFLHVDLVPQNVLDFVTPYFAALAIIVILFDGGLNLNYDKVLKRINIAFVHTLVAFTITVVAVSIIAYLVLGYPPVVGLLLGSIVGGTSGVVVLTIVRQMNVSEDTKTILSLESVLSDVLCIATAFAFIEIMRGGGYNTASVAFGTVATAFSIALVIGLIFGIFWLKVLKVLYGKAFSFMITIAALFLLYAIVEFVGGSGAMSSLVFGLVLGNHDEFAQMFKMKTKFVLDKRIRQFHSELSFVVRTFFFVLLGLLFTLELGSLWQVQTQIPFLDQFNGTFLLFLVGVLSIFLAIIAVRCLAASLTVSIHRESRRDKTALWVVMGRGLVASVLASFPFTIPEFADTGSQYFAYLSPYKSQFLNIAFLIIVLSVVATTIGAFISERSQAGKEPIEVFKERMRKRREIEEKKKWKREEAQRRRQRIRLAKEKRRLEEMRKRKEKLGL